jgi:hypothetical protein
MESDGQCMSVVNNIVHDYRYIKHLYIYVCGVRAMPSEGDPYHYIVCCASSLFLPPNKRCDQVTTITVGLYRRQLLHRNSTTRLPFELTASFVLATL